MTDSPKPIYMERAEKQDAHAEQLAVIAEVMARDLAMLALAGYSMTEGLMLYHLWRDAA